MKRRIRIFLKRYKKLVLTFLIVFVLVIFLIVRKKDNVYASNDIIEETEVEEVEIDNNIEEEIKEELPKIKVDIKGEVNNPGVYELELGNRIIDVVNLSGGLTKKAVTKEVNLSKKIYDEMVIIIPDTESTCIVTPKYSVEEEGTNEVNGLININTASKEQLLNITGIGESKANAIIEYRSKNKFNTIEDIMNIQGIKESLFNKIKDEITV